MWLTTESGFSLFLCVCEGERGKKRERESAKRHIKRLSLRATCSTSLRPGDTINLAGTTSPLPSRISTKRLTWDRHTGFTSEPINQVSRLCVDEVRFWHVVLQPLGQMQGTGLDLQYLHHAIIKKKEKWDLCCCFFFLVNIDSRCVIRNVCQTQIVLFLPAEINLFNAESNHPLRLQPCRGLSTCCCVGRLRQRPPVQCGEPVNSEPLSVGIWFVTQQTRRLWLSHLAGHTRFSPSLCLSLFFSTPHPHTQGVSKGSPPGQNCWHTYLNARGSHPHLSVTSVKSAAGKNHHGWSTLLRDSSFERCRVRCCRDHLHSSRQEMHTYQCQARLSLKREPHKVAFCQSHIWAAPQGRRWKTEAQKRSQTKTEASWLFTSLPLRWQKHHGETWWKNLCWSIF